MNLPKWLKSKHTLIGVASIVLPAVTMYLQGAQWRDIALAAVGTAMVLLGVEKRAGK
jgi:hypothetical protein